MANVQSILDQKGSSVYSIKPDDVLAHALLQLKERKVGALLVLNEAGDIKGILSERDIVRYFARRIERVNTTEIKVKEVMTAGVTCVKRHQSLEDCLQLMTVGRFRHLPVVDDGGKVMGIVSIGDVVKAVLDAKDTQIGDLEQYITSSY
ncbi:MAG: CBS domain-containing protein [Spirochaetales bacterium]|jgi:CBS domain-containing protein|nr:CBS domain-containing protein [Spirochaetales bacterium]